MWSRVRRAGFVMALALPCSLSAVQSAYAGLGGTPMTPPTDASVSSRTVQPGHQFGNGGAKRDAFCIERCFFHLGFRVLHRA